MLHPLQPSGLFARAVFQLYPYRYTARQQDQPVGKSVLDIRQELDTLTTQLTDLPTEIAFHILFQLHGEPPPKWTMTVLDDIFYKVLQV